MLSSRCSCKHNLLCVVSAVRWPSVAYGLTNKTHTNRMQNARKSQQKRAHATAKTREQIRKLFCNARKRKKFKQSRKKVAQKLQEDENCRQLELPAQPKSPQQQSRQQLSAIAVAVAVAGAAAAAATAEIITTTTSCKTPTKRSEQKSPSKKVAK